MELSAPAKINLFLSVGARREDGLHRLVSVMQAVSLADMVTLEAADAVSVRVTPAGAAPEDDTNVAGRAARTFLTVQGIDSGVAVTLEKRIPAAAGLAGGSADAAATLVGCNALFDARVSKKALEKIGATLGSDVPFCVRGGTAVVGGAGEDLSSIACPQPVWWVLGCSDRALSTAAVYTEFDRLGGGAEDDPFDVADALARADLDRLARALRNDLEPAAFSLDASLAAGRDVLIDAGAIGAMMSGSGPTWCGLARDEAHAGDVAARAAASFDRIEVVCSIGHGPRITQR